MTDRAAATPRFRRPESVLVIIHTPALDFLMLERTEPRDFWQSVTGTLRWEETPHQAARREVIEETGLDPSGLRDGHATRRFPILPAWRARYAPDVRENLEHLWYLEWPERSAITLNPDEHLRYQWLPLAAAIEMASSWTNREGIERLAREHGVR